MSKVKKYNQFNESNNSNSEFDKLIDKLSTMGVSEEHISEYRELSVEFENEDDEWEKKAILDTFSIDLELEYGDTYFDVEEDIMNLYLEIGLDLKFFK